MRATSEILLYGAALWSSGVVILAAASAYASRLPSSRHPAAWAVAPAIFIGWIPAGAGAIVVGGQTGQLAGAAIDCNGALLMIAGLVGAVAAWWANAIIVQVAQNVGYRLVGSPPQPIRWHRNYKPARKRRPRPKSATAAEKATG